MASPEKRELVAAIDLARLDVILAALRPEADDNHLERLLIAYESRQWIDRDDVAPAHYPGWVHFMRLNTEYRERVRRLIVVALVARGGSFVYELEKWCSDGNRLWKAMR